MNTMHQVVLLTTNEISKETLAALFQLVADDARRENSDARPWTGTAFKLAEKVALPIDQATGMPAIWPQNIERIYGPLAS